MASMNNGKSASKIKRALTHSTFLTSALFGAAVIGVSTPASANPVLDNIAHGDVHTATSGNKFDVIQNSQKAIINWKDFSIAEGEHTEFKQLNADAVALNRVTGKNLSAIYGKLSANGRIILVNPNGVVFGPTAQVNVGSLIATTANIGDKDFIDGNYKFTAAPAGSSVINEGSITVKQNGVAALVAPEVRNDGVIYGNASKISLAGADSFAIDLYGDGLVNLQVSETASVNGKVENNGSIYNSQGTVVLTADQASDLINSVVNMGSVKHAASAKIVGKSIVLDAGVGGTLDVAGNIDASGAANGQLNGGTVDLKGKTVNIQASAAVKASGAQGENGGAINLIAKDFSLRGTFEAGKNGTVKIDPTQLFVRNGNDGGVPAANSVYEEWIETLSQAGTNVVLEASELIEVQDIADDEITGGSGSIKLTTYEGGSTIGAIRFVSKDDAIKTTTGNIVIEAGSGGIDIGDLRVEAGTQNAGSIRMKTINGGTINAELLKVQGRGNALLDIKSEGTVTVDDINLDASAENGNAIAKATISTFGSTSDVVIGDIEARSDVLGTAGAPADLAATTLVRIVSQGSATTGNINAAANTKVGTVASNMTSDARVHVYGNNDVTTAGTVNLVATTENMGLGSNSLPQDRKAISKTEFRANAENNTVTNDVRILTLSTVESDAYREISALSEGHIWAGNNATTNGDITSSVLADASSGIKGGLSDITAKGLINVSGINNATVNGDIFLLADTLADGRFVDNINSEASGIVRSHNGNTVVNGDISISAEGEGNGALPIDIVVQFLKNNAGYGNTFGTYNTDTGAGEIVWSNLKNATAGDTFTISVEDLSKQGFFLIGDGVGNNLSGDGINPTYKNNDQITFQKNGNGEWQAFHNGQGLNGSGIPAYISTVPGATGALSPADAADNADGVDHAYDSPADGNSNWEDLPGGGDFDYDDVNFNITANQGTKGKANASAKLQLLADNGTVIANGDTDVNASLNIQGNGYSDAKAIAFTSIKAADAIVINGDANVTSIVDSSLTTVDNASSQALIIMQASGQNNPGDITINGDLEATAIATETQDFAQALIFADAQNNINFGAGIVDPLARTETFFGDDSSVQAKTSLRQETNNDSSELVFRGNIVVPPTPTPTPTITNQLNTVFIDPLSRYLISLRDAGLLPYENQRPYSVSLNLENLSLLNSGGAAPTNLSPDQLGSLAPAAGGMDGGNNSVSCANNYLDSGYGAGVDVQQCGANTNTNTNL